MSMSKKDATRVKALEIELARIRGEISAIQSPYEQSKAESMVGQCFRVRNNYSCPEGPEDYWWLYARVLAAEDGNLRCLRFEVDKNGDARVQTNTLDVRWVYEGYERISVEEFNSQYALMLEHLAKANATGVPQP